MVQWSLVQFHASWEASDITILLICHCNCAFSFHAIAGGLIIHYHTYHVLNFYTTRTPRFVFFLHASSPQLNFRSFSSTASSKRTAFSGAMVQCSCPTLGAADHPSFHPTALWSRSARLVPRTASRWSPRSPWSAWSAGAGADVPQHGRCGCHRRTRRRRSRRQGLGRWAVGVSAYDT